MDDELFDLSAGHPGLGDAPDIGPPGMQAPDGTTDWEAVFEDGKAGLMPLIGQAQSAAPVIIDGIPATPLPEGARWGIVVRVI